MNLVKRITIDAPIEKVFSTLNDMKTWEHWSPWLITDPQTAVIASDKEYSWEGNRVGSGHMEIVKEVPNEYVYYDLTFLKPWKSTAKIKFTTEENSSGTEVAWYMDSSLPWFMFWMKKMMVAMIGNDYERGLKLLKDYVEEGKVNSKLNWIGEMEYPGCKYIGIKRTTTIDAMPTTMQKDFENLIAFAKSISDSSIERSFSQYHKFDFVQKMASFTSGIPIKSVPANLPDDAFIGKMPRTKIYRLEHVGRYDHLGNAWSTMYMMHRNKEFKLRKGIDPFETYGNSPKDTHPNDLISYINFAIK